MPDDVGRKKPTTTLEDAEPVTMRHWSVVDSQLVAAKETESPVRIQLSELVEKLASSPNRLVVLHEVDGVAVALVDEVPVGEVLVDEELE